jgi:hypothetical protein
MKISNLFLSLVIVTIVWSCQQKEANPNLNQFIVDKWWCARPGTGTIAAQFFNSNGNWEQGSKGGKFNDSGQWKYSNQGKKIVISSVLDYTKKAKSGWEYSIENVSEGNLSMNWSSFGVKMDLEICK